MLKCLLNDRFCEHKKWLSNTVPPDATYVDSLWIFASYVIILIVHPGLSDAILLLC